MRKGIILGIGIFVILLALAGTGSAKSGFTVGVVSCTQCHPSGFTPNATGDQYKLIHKFDGITYPTTSVSCGNCHTNMLTTFFPLTSNGSLYNSTHRNATTLASVNLIGTTKGCNNCHNDTVGGSFILVTGAGTSLLSATCDYCHPRLVEDWNDSKHSNPTKNVSAADAQLNLTGNFIPAPIQCTICHNEHNATDRVVIINTTCTADSCHASYNRTTYAITNNLTKHSYNLTQCKFCHLPKVLTVNTPFDTRSHTWEYTNQLVSSSDDERHAAVFNELKNVTKTDGVTKASCDNCHGNSNIPNANMRLSYRLTKHYNASANNVSANAATPYCDDCHKTTLTTEVINETNTCRNSGCHISMNETHAKQIGGADCTNCHFNNSDPLKTHNLYFANGNEIKYTCKLCHTSDSNKSIVAQIDEWNSSVHNDRLNSVEGGPNHFFNISNLVSSTGIVGSQTSSCNKCHSPLDWNPAIADSSSTKVSQTATFKGIACSVCHNLHDMDDWYNKTGKVYGWYNGDAIKISDTEYQANYTNVTDTTELCGNCHSNIRYGSTGPGLTTPSSRNSYTGFIYPHGFPAKDLFMGSPKQAGQGFECIDCHMYKNTNYGQGTQGDSEKITGHSFKVNKTGLQSTSCGTTCHNGTTFPTIPVRIEQVQTEIEDQWNSTNATVMGAFYNVNSSTQEKGLSLNKLSQAYWNLKLVQNDESWGVHNPELAKSLLTDAVTLANAANASLGQGTSSVDLVTGWNLVALNGTPSVTAPKDVMSSVKSNIAVVWGYNATVPKWELYDPAMPADYTGENILTTMVPGKGYWIYANIACKWTV